MGDKTTISSSSPPAFVEPARPTLERSMLGACAHSNPALMSRC